MLPSWGMPSPALPILSPSLSAKLAALATRPATNRELDDILTELELPVDEMNVVEALRGQQPEEGSVELALT